MDKQKAIAMSKQIEVMTDKMVELMQDAAFDGDHISLTANKNGFITIAFSDVNTEKAGPNASYVTRQTSILER